MGTSALSTYAERLRAARTAQGLSSEHVAEAVGLSANALWRLESGATAVPSVTVAARLYQVLGVAPDGFGLPAGTTSTPSIPSDLESLLTVEQVADILHLSRTKTYDEIKAGHLRAVRIGKAVRVRPSVLRAYIAQREGTLTLLPDDLES